MSNRLGNRSNAVGENEEPSCANRSPNYECSGNLKSVSTIPMEGKKQPFPTAPSKWKPDAKCTVPFTALRPLLEETGDDDPLGYGPAEPTSSWRLVAMKGNEPAPSFQVRRMLSAASRSYPIPKATASTLTSSLDLRTQSAFLIGRDRVACDIPLEHDSISSQHAVLYFMLVPQDRPRKRHREPEGFEEDDALERDKEVSPKYREERQGSLRLTLCDLGSTNGTFLNGKRLPPFVPTILQLGDVLQLGQSSRRFVFVAPKR
jgi:hypothetical protein